VQQPSAETVVTVTTKRDRGTRKSVLVGNIFSST